MLTVFGPRGNHRPMTLAEKQQQLIAKWRLIEDPQERLAAIVARAKKWPAPTAEERIEANRVTGCVSQVWLVGRVVEGHCRFSMDADSPLVKGLVTLVCELYDGATPREVATVEPEIITALGLDRQLSPTRLNGLISVRQAIRAFTEKQLAS
jgi:cysteine desulfuration protein SufE